MSRNRRRSKSQKSSGHLENYSKRILSVLRENPEKALNYKQIAARLGIEDEENRQQIIRNLEQLSNKSKIDPKGRGKFQIAGNPDYYEGILDMTTHGNGYVIVDELEVDIFIAHKKLNHALDGDKVQVLLLDSHGKKPEGEITAVLQRKTNWFVGILRLKATFGFVEVNNPKMYTDIFIPRNRTKNAQDGEVVKVELEKWPKKEDSPEGKVLEVLGKPGVHETEIQTILAESGLSSVFPKEVEDFAKQIDTTLQKQEIKKRRDMREVHTFTIDPADAKDFDDALSFQVLENGNYEVGIHIADVSFYVQPGTILDEEAYDRGNSIYLVDRTIPMLPEVLSNNVCSLWPNADKYTFSAIFEINKNAVIKDQWFGRTVIRSNERFSYKEAQYILDTQSGSIPKKLGVEGKARKASKETVEALISMNKLAKKMRAKRMKMGAISFDKIEVKFNLDKDKNPIGVYFEREMDANRLIEEFMLLTNRKVSEFISKQKPKKTFVYRCHDEPDGDKLFALKTLVGRFGYQLNLKDRKSITKSLNSLLEQVNGKKEENLIDTLAIRTMSKAYYSTKNIGHYGLAFDYYSHFTAPIRRYSDILAHRLLQRYLEGKPSASEEKYEEMCKKCSNAEIYAVDAERDSIKYMQVKYMQKHHNEVFLGVISGVTDFGIFVEIEENKCEGLVRLREIREDHFDYVEEEFAIVGRKSKKTYRLGDEVYVRVKATDLAKRNLDFDLLSTEADLKRQK